ncbi:hypothetical protein DSO57_1017768 [Entomophthora muscae]|uniref:Uncharacterized protein n=1 Tax=Entomophthora muscae TaxID=34485 RepID=A0ACC2S6K0_9FUNG|nr:hypothetical protein DSO57_1017768 [Entomophthora muscae]
MRIKLNVTLDFELEAQPTENKTMKTVHLIDESEQERNDKTFTIKHLLRDISKKLGVDRKADMSANLEGYLIPNDYPVTKILKEDDTLGVVFKPKSSTLLPAAVTETHETKQKSLSKRKLEEPAETKKPSKVLAKKNGTEEKKVVPVSESKEEDASVQLGTKLSKAKKRQLRRLRVLKAVGLKETTSDSTQPDVPALPPGIIYIFHL